MAKLLNAHSILFLYEGDTEKEFYNKILTQNLPPRSIRIERGNLHGVYSLDIKVENKINSYLDSEKYKDCKNIHVFVAYDREGIRTKKSALNISLLQKKFITKKSRVKSINEVIATQDLESWFFYDLEGIYRYLRVPVSERNIDKYSNPEKMHNRILSALFHKHNKHYQKGKKAEGFIDYLDLNLIRDSVVELGEFIKILKSIA